MSPTPDLHTLLAATTYLMTRYSLQRGTDNLTCGSMSSAEGIKHHLEMLLEHPDVQASPTAMSAYKGLLWEWVGVLAQHQHQHTGNEPRPAATGRLGHKQTLH